MNTSKPTKLGYKLILYLSIFSIGLILIMLIVEIFLKKISYEKYQLNYINNLATTISEYNEDEIFEELDNISLENDICLEYMDNWGNKYYYNEKTKDCLLDKRGLLEKNISSIKESNEEIKAVKLINPANDSTSVLYGVKVGTGYVFIFSSLEDIRTTSSLLNWQTIYITITLMVVSILIALYLTKKISKPILNITDKAEEIAKGNYDVEFKPVGITEIDSLSETLNYMKDEFSKTDEYRRDLMANVSHDLKTPLTMIKAYAEMVRDITYKDDKKREENLNVIIDETDRLNLLVNDILELSKVQSNTESLNIEEFDLIDCIKDVLKRYEIIKETENYNITLESPDKVLIKADKKRINQVMYNLINNAINYTGQDKKVTIKVTENKNDYLVEVIDTGKGINEEDLKNIWNKYYKNEKNHKRNVVGTGLGLSIVKGILEAHNFKYGVKSIKGKGTTFYFKIIK